HSGILLAWSGPRNRFVRI
nr:Chain L, Conorfamide-Tx2 [Conus textile]